MPFDALRGPPAIAQGEAGTLRIGGLRAGAFRSWRVVISPTTGKPTLFGAGRFAHYYAGAVGVTVEASLTPAPPPTRLGRPKPKTPVPFVLRGRLLELGGGRITIADGEIARG